MLPRVNSATKLCNNSDLYEIELGDWSDVSFPTTAIVLWSEYFGSYCLAETAKSLEDYSELFFPGIATTCFEELPWSAMVPIDGRGRRPDKSRPTVHHLQWS